jgi:Enoyl-(Acyl carrier protein) reductase
LRPSNWLEDITDEEWSRDLREEVDLVFYLTRAAWPHLKAKPGIIGMTRQLAMEGREHGIRANSISAGLIETNQTRDSEESSYA